MNLVRSGTALFVSGFLLLFFFAQITLVLSKAQAESYVAGQFGATFPGSGLFSGDVTSTTAAFRTRLEQSTSQAALRSATNL